MRFSFLYSPFPAALLEERKMMVLVGLGSLPLSATSTSTLKRERIIFKTAIIICAIHCVPPKNPERWVRQM